MLKNKYSMTKKENIFLAKKNFVSMIHSISRFENVNTTLPQTQTIIDGMAVSGVSIADTQVIVDLKRGLEYVLNHEGDMDIEVAKSINRLVAANDALYPGELRTGDVTIGGVEYVPPIPQEEEFKTVLDMFDVEKESLTDQVIKIMFYMMRNQYFWDGNKRTSLLIANYVLISNGLGVLVILEKQMEIFNKLLSKYYESNNNEEIVKWTYENCLFGIEYKS